MNEQEALNLWFQRLQTEWLPNWRDMPDTTFVWWNLLVIALEDTVDERY